MSIDIRWETITSGPDGEALAEKIRSFIHDKFQQVSLPRFIRAVHVHSFDFGKVSPEVEIKDMCDPLPQFYEEDVDEGDDDQLANAESDDGFHTGLAEEHVETTLQHQLAHGKEGPGSTSFASPTLSGNDSHSRMLSQLQNQLPTRLSDLAQLDQLASPFPRSGTPGIPGGTSNLSYFHLPLGGISGTQTPLAAVASGTPFSATGWSSDHHQQFPHLIRYSNLAPAPHHAASGGDYSRSPTRPSTANTLSSPGEPAGPMSPASPDKGPGPVFLQPVKVSDDPNREPESSIPPPPSFHAPQPSDLQVVARMKYAGDIRMTLAAEILLDYPMPSFVAIPLMLSIVGMTFDGVAILASIRKRVHFCFLCPEDAQALVGDQVGVHQGQGGATGISAQKMGGLLQEIRVESEIGRKESGKQVLKNVGKVEKFVLEQVRRIFEEEFVFPSFWTFLV